MRRGFTLIELLIVIGIILLLAALIISVSGIVRRKAGLLASSQRLSEGVQAILGSYSDGLGAVGLHRDLHATVQAMGGTADEVPGVRAFLVDRRYGITMPATGGGSWIPLPYPSYCFDYPWGQVPAHDPDVSATTLSPPDTTYPVQDRALSQLNPRHSAALWHLAGLLADDPASSLAAYTSDRGPTKPWNDAWGKPLVIAWGLYQPRCNTLISIKVPMGGSDNAAKTRQDLFLQRAMEVYGYGRAFYLAGGALGPRLSSTLNAIDLTSSASNWTGSGGVLDQAWSDIIEVAGTEDGVEQWRTDSSVSPAVNAWNDPPWKGIKTARTEGRDCALLSPAEMR
ncbi:MAG: prepilin-type N-terminal cleavage/methylation domain-containing protein [Planctomycetota bacterium]|nr:prepilin-type N-terminal cleavage/methylation domain-containing protein [Planctomycetota bacterium]